MNSSFTIENLFAPLYLSTAICYGAYNYKIKFRFKQNYKKIEERIIFSLLFILSILLICSELMYLYYIQEYNHLKKIDIANIAFLLFITILAKYSSYRTDNIKDMSIIVEKKEASTYGLLKLWIILTSITLFPIIQLSSNSKIDFFYTSMYALSAISILVHEGWERLLPIRFLYIENVRGEKIKNKNLIELFSNKKLFWFRELSGNITKSTVNCWISFVILAMLIAKIKNNSFCYEGKTIVFDNYLNISSAFYIAASEIFFSGSGIFPCHSLSKVAFFSMHIYGLFLYGVFFAIGIQAFSFKNYPGDK